MEGTKRDIKPCKECGQTSSEGFQKVLELKNSGLVIYKHEVENKQQGKYRTKCFKCRSLIQRIQSLLNDLIEVKAEQILGVCRYCKQPNASGKCKRCDYIVNKFFSHNMKQYEDRQTRFLAWLDKVKHLLLTVLEEESNCKHNLFKATAAVELENLLQQLKQPLSLRQPVIGIFPPEEDLSSVTNLTESKIILEELLIRIKTEHLRNKICSDESWNVCPPIGTTCICKYLMDKKIEEQMPLKMLAENKTTHSVAEIRKDNIGKNIEVKKFKVHDKPIDKTVIDKNNSLIDKDNITPKNKKNIYDNKLVNKKKVKDTKVTNYSKEKLKSSIDEVNFINNAKKVSSLTQTPKEKSPKLRQSSADQNTLNTIKKKHTSEDDILIRLIKAKKKEKIGINEKVKKGEKLNLPKFGEMPRLRLKERSYDEDVTSASILECGDDSLPKPLEMIKGECIVPFDAHYKHEKTAQDKVPLLFKVTPICHDPKPNGLNTISLSDHDNGVQHLPHLKGILKYELSNKEFVDKGWTRLPTEKIMRKMNIYKMIPSNPQYDWFRRHENRKVIYYETGEKLADFDYDGGGRWYYKNGRVALKYYKAQELNIERRYIVYSSGEEIDCDKVNHTILATFDLLGNGVVYDYYGKIRLKYNQSEGLVVDSKIGPPGKWKWHTLNDPPLLQPVFIETLEQDNSCLDYILNNQRDDKSEAGSQMRNNNTDMLAIELENLVKAKAHKLHQKFKPFHYRMKVLKVNDQFSLRILDQANIYLMYRDGLTSLKLNLGMILISSEIVDTETTEMSDVSTPYDRKPARSKSVADIQEILNKAKRTGRTLQKKASRFMKL